jgi:uncharacterized membrane protein YfhO
MQDGATSYFHNSIGGYHAAKMGRYQELFDYQISKRNMGVFDMLNTKYFIVQDDKGENQVQQNPNANGNAWFVQNLIQAKNSNEEITLLDSINNKVAIVKEKDYPKIKVGFTVSSDIDSLATIDLVNYEVTTLKYTSKSSKEQFAVFSEIYYKEGWNAYVDGVLTPHYQVNYVLRGMVIPKGAHTITFQFEPKVIQQGKLISLTSYALLLFISVGWFFYEKKKKS